MGAPACGDKFLRTKGFVVEISGGGNRESDGNWQMASGGPMIIVRADETVGSDLSRTFTPGHSAVSAITLRGFVTPHRRAMLQWLNDTLSRNDVHRDVSIIAEDGTSTTYRDCVLVSYTFPELDASDPDAPVEELRFAFPPPTP